MAMNKTYIEVLVKKKMLKISSENTIETRASTKNTSHGTSRIPLGFLESLEYAKWEMFRANVNSKF